MNFVSWAYKSAGWDGVNALLARPPRSTEQVLHPEKYFVKPENPIRVQIGALAPYLRGEWQLAEEATLGEFTIRILAERFVDRAGATAIAAGWDGDRLDGVVPRRSAGARLAHRLGHRPGCDRVLRCVARDRREPSSRSAAGPP